MNGFYMRCNNELKWINSYSLRPRHYDAIYVKGKLYLFVLGTSLPEVFWKIIRRFPVRKQQWESFYSITKRLATLPRKLQCRRCFLRNTVQFFRVVILLTFYDVFQHWWAFQKRIITTVLRFSSFCLEKKNFFRKGSFIWHVLKIFRKSNISYPLICIRGWEMWVFSGNFVDAPNGWSLS